MSIFGPLRQPNRVNRKTNRTPLRYMTWTIETGDSYSEQPGWIKNIRVDHKVQMPRRNPKARHQAKGTRWQEAMAQPDSHLPWMKHPGCDRCASRAGRSRMPDIFWARSFSATVWPNGVFWDAFFDFQNQLCESTTLMSQRLNLPCLH
jgi:hypothetical protein